MKNCNIQLTYDDVELFCKHYGIDDFNTKTLWDLLFELGFYELYSRRYTFKDDVEIYRVCHNFIISYINTHIDRGGDSKTATMVLSAIFSLYVLFEEKATIFHIFSWELIQRYITYDDQYSFALLAEIGRKIKSVGGNNKIDEDKKIEERENFQNLVNELMIRRKISFSRALELVAKDKDTSVSTIKRRGVRKPG